jgi:DNA-binding CsgD family transcriptional regulator
MGKSRLLDEVATMATRMSFKAGRGAAGRGEGGVELATLMAALCDGEEPIATQATLQDLRATVDQRYWVLQELHTLLERAASETPLLVCIDDAQWIDDGTAAALRALPPRLAELPIGWVVAHRPNDVTRRLSRDIDQLTGGRATKIVLNRLDRDAVEQVATDVMHAEPDQALLDIAESASGSPDLLVDLLRGLNAEQLVRVDSGRAELIEARLPHCVGDTVRERLSQRSDAAREAANVAAALGRSFSFTELATMLNLTPSALIAPIRELIEGDVLIEADAKLAFRHDHTREAVRASLPVSAMRALDRHAASVLLAGGALPVEVATQIAASAEPGDEFAIATLVSAVAALGTSDPGAAADLGRRALSLTPAKHPLRGPLVAQTAVLLHCAARSTEAKEVADSALCHSLTSEHEADVQLSIAGMASLSADERVSASQQALGLPELSPGTRAKHLARLVHNLLIAGRADEARATIAEARSAADASGDGAATVTLDLAEAGLEYLDGALDLSLAKIEAAARGRRDPEDGATSRATQDWRGDVLAALDRLPESLKIATDGIAVARGDRQLWSLRVSEDALARRLLAMGQVREAAAAVDGRFESGSEHLVVDNFHAAALVAVGRIALHTGNGRQTRQTAEVAQSMLTCGTPGVRRHAVWLLALQAMAEGDAPGARAWLCSLGEEQRKSILPLLPMEATDDVHMVRIAIAADDRDLAESALSAAMRRAALNSGVRSIAAAAAHARGLLRGSRDDLASAVDLFETGPRPLALASALEDLGVADVKSQVAVWGLEALDRALVLYTRAGATRDAARVRGRLRALGVHRRVGSTERPASGWAAMTESELAVVRLVADGHTNRATADQLFISPHTVNSHLRHVFAKLDVNSRVELARLAGDHDRR